MKALIQVVEEAEVSIEGNSVGSIDNGALVFLGIKEDDEVDQVKELADKILNLRIFPDEQGDMNLSLRDIEGEIMVISQFTLYGEINSGRRPNFSRAGDYEQARKLYREFVKRLEGEAPSHVESGEFGKHMKVNLTNDGPITFLLES